MRINIAMSHVTYRVWAYESPWAWSTTAPAYLDCRIWDRWVDRPRPRFEAHVHAGVHQIIIVRCRHRPSVIVKSVVDRSSDRWADEHETRWDQWSDRRWAGMSWHYLAWAGMSVAGIVWRLASSGSLAISKVIFIVDFHLIKISKDRRYSIDEWRSVHRIKTIVSSTHEPTIHKPERWAMRMSSAISWSLSVQCLCLYCTVLDS